MRFPPKSYNKDLESAEVSCLPLQVQLEHRTSLQKGKRGVPGRAGAAVQLLAWAGSGWGPSAARPHPISPQERREREQQDLEFAKEMAEDDDDSFP